MVVKPSELGLLWGYLGVGYRIFHGDRLTFPVPCFEQRSNNVQKWAAYIFQLDGSRLVFD